jgi:light-regulated signal transduction histidine kinase (bacteriophytochrome)
LAEHHERAVGDLAYGTPIDLTNCEREPIHIPGQIQSHGVLLAFEPRQLLLEQVSDNAPAWLGRPVEQLLGCAAPALLGRQELLALEDALQSQPMEGNPLYLFTGPVCGQGPFHAIGHLYQGVLIIELERPQNGSAPRPDFYELLKRSVARFQAARTVSEFSQQVVEEVRSVSGYDRVMVYRFGADWSGHVVAESMAPGKGLESYLGLHYPASDIPAQARALFLLNTVRMLPDARYRQAKLLPELSPRTGLPLDLSHTFLRGASQMYTEYLTNMGVRATLTMAIAKGGKLWGMLVCHHYSVRQIPYDVRAACELLARVVSVQISDKQLHEESAYKGRLASVHDQLVRALARTEELEQALAVGPPDVHQFVHAGGAAVVTGARCRLLGRTPSEEQVQHLVDWLQGAQTGDLFVTDTLPSLYPPAAQFEETACGLLAVQLSRAQREYVLWMRPELVRTEKWAGDPNKPVETGPMGDRLTPRKSFALWQETVRGKSAPFSELEREAAMRLRAALAERLLIRGEKLARAAHRSRSLLLVADALSAAQTEPEVTQVLLSRALEASGAQAAFVDRLAKGAAALETTGHGEPSLLPPGLRTLAEAAGPAQALRTGLLVLHERGLHLPLSSTGRLGVLSFAWAAPRSFSREDEEFFQTLAKLGGQALQRARLADEALQASEAYRGSLVDSLDDHVAVLDPQGVIAEVNEAWRRFAEKNGGDARACGVGANYLEACARAIGSDDTGHARATVDGLRLVMEGKKARFELEYECPSPTGPLWFTLRVSPAAGRPAGSVVICHSDITTIKLAQERLRVALREVEALVHEVREQNVRVEEASRLKSEFLANMSHELRTPLNGIIGFSELMYDGKAGALSNVQREYLGDVLSSAHHLHELINDVLDLTKVEAGRMQFDPQPVDLHLLLRDARDILRTMAAKKHIEVRLSADAALDDVTLDPQRFKQVLFNYLSNAIKFTPDGGAVEMRVVPEGEGEFRLDVEDSGVGVKESDLPRLFVEFQQLDSSKSKRYAGTGLGLALTRRIVEAQGGRVFARSTPGKGSVFSAVLPRRPRTGP